MRSVIVCLLEHQVNVGFMGKKSCLHRGPKLATFWFRGRLSTPAPLGRCELAAIYQAIYGWRRWNVATFTRLIILRKCLHLSLCGLFDRDFADSLSDTHFGGDLTFRFFSPHITETTRPQIFFKESAPDPLITKLYASSRLWKWMDILTLEASQYLKKL